MIELVLFSILVLFFIFIIIKPFIVKLTGRFCSICASVSGTWIILILMKVLGYYVDPLVVGILMGGSVVGLMYKFEEYVKKGNEKLLILRIFILIFGFFIVYSFIKYLWGGFKMIFWVMLIILILFTWALFLSFGKKKTKIMKGLEKKLKDCC